MELLISLFNLRLLFSDHCLPELLIKAKGLQITFGVSWLFLCLIFVLSFSILCGGGTGRWFSPKVV